MDVGWFPEYAWGGSEKRIGPRYEPEGPRKRALGVSKGAAQPHSSLAGSSWARDCFVVGASMGHLR